jgi:hypothetical protein
VVLTDCGLGIGVCILTTGLDGYVGMVSNPNSSSGSGLYSDVPVCLGQRIKLSLIQCCEVDGAIIKSPDCSLGTVRLA